jgi:peroxin-1
MCLLQQAVLIWSVLNRRLQPFLPLRLSRTMYWCDYYFSYSLSICMWMQIDSALLRPGRLDKSVFCDIPNLEDRVSILHAQARTVTLHPDVDFKEIAANTPNFSGADLKAVITNAQMHAVTSTHDLTGTSLENVRTGKAGVSPASHTFYQVGPSGAPVHPIVSHHLSTALKFAAESIIATTTEARQLAVPAIATTHTSTKPTTVITQEHLRIAAAALRPSVSEQVRQPLPEPKPKQPTHACAHR